MKRVQIAIGPELPDFGSWNWIGRDVLDGFSPEYHTEAFSEIDSPPEADVTIFLKFKPSAERLRELRSETRLVYMPVDVYGSTAEIDGDRPSLVNFDQIVVHCGRLVRYFSAMAPTDYLDHSLRYITENPVDPAADGHLLWVGRQCNLQPVVSWVNRLVLDRPLQVLTEGITGRERPEEWGFLAHNEVRLATWSADRHVDMLRSAVAAVDVKGDDFRSRHKPPAKVLDFLASGLPVVINRGSSADLHLQSLGIRSVWSESGMPEWNTLLQSSTLRTQATALRSALDRHRVRQKLGGLLQGIVRRPGSIAL